MQDSSRQTLDAGLRALGFALPPTALAALLDYRDELVKWNAAYNLTAIRDPQEMVVRHLLDSLALLPVLREVREPLRDARLLDVGAGAGLPGLVLAIAEPVLRVSTLDSNGKKARFMRHAARTLKLEVDVIEGRVEDQSGSYEIITSRAFASLADFFDKTSHLLVAGGVWVAMKGKLDAQELADIPADVEIRETRRLQVPGLNEDRHAVIAVKKAS